MCSLLTAVKFVLNFRDSVYYKVITSNVFDSLIVLELEYLMFVET